MTLQKSAHALRRRTRLRLDRRLVRARFTEAIVLGFHVGAWAPVTGALVLKRRRVPRLPMKHIPNRSTRRLGGLQNKGKDRMKRARMPIALALISLLGIAHASAECQIADAQLEEAILKNPKLRGPEHRQVVRDLRSLRDAAFTLRSYGRQEDCERLLGNIRELISGPPMGSLGDNDEDEADKQIAAREPMVQRGGERGRRNEKGAKPLIRIDQLAPGLRADEIIGLEVRTSTTRSWARFGTSCLGRKTQRLCRRNAKIL